MSIPDVRPGHPVKTRDMLIGALLRVPAQAIHRRIIAELNAAGFRELRLPHMALFQFPGLDGARPGSLAERAGISKQAMNQLLRSLEGYGYLERSDASDDAGARAVHSRVRAPAAYMKAIEVLQDIESEWRAELGAADFDRLKQLLGRIWDSPLVR
jgi:DNA-binding MarR family transcriptional regulator